LFDKLQPDIIQLLDAVAGIASFDVKTIEKYRPNLVETGVMSNQGDFNAVVVPAAAVLFGSNFRVLVKKFTSIAVYRCEQVKESCF
jgi:hypothetical protein